MVDAGLLQEVEQLQQLLLKKQEEMESSKGKEQEEGKGSYEAASSSFTTGVLQAIGYKEFVGYLEMRQLAAQGKRSMDEVAKVVTHVHGVVFAKCLCDVLPFLGSKLRPLLLDV